MHGKTLGKEDLVGILLTSYYIAGAFIQPPAGKLSDIIGRYRATLLAYITCALGFFILTFAPSPVFLLVAVVVVGGGVGTLYLALTALLMDVASPPSTRIDRWLSEHSIGGSVILSAQRSEA